MIMTNKNISEEKTVAASYIINFYEQVTNLNHTVAQHINVMTELKSKYDGSEDKLNEVEKKTVIDSSHYVRYAVVQCYIQYSSIIDNLQEKHDKSDVEQRNNIIRLYNIIKSNTIIKIEDAEGMATEMNKIMIKKVIKNLLETSQDLIDKVSQSMEDGR